MLNLQDNLNQKIGYEDINHGNKEKGGKAIEDLVNSYVYDIKKNKWKILTNANNNDFIREISQRLNIKYYIPYDNTKHKYILDSIEEKFKYYLLVDRYIKSNKFSKFIEVFDEFKKEVNKKSEINEVFDEYLIKPLNTISLIYPGEDYIYINKIYKSFLNIKLITLKKKRQILKTKHTNFNFNLLNNYNILLLYRYLLNFNKPVKVENLVDIEEKYNGSGIDLTSLLDDIIDDKFEFSNYNDILKVFYTNDESDESKKMEKYLTSDIVNIDIELGLKNDEKKTVKYINSKVDDYFKIFYIAGIDDDDKIENFENNIYIFYLLDYLNYGNRIWYLNSFEAILKVSEREDNQVNSIVSEKRTVDRTFLKYINLNFNYDNHSDNVLKNYELSKYEFQVFNIDEVEEILGTNNNPWLNQDLV